MLTAQAWDGQGLARIVLSGGSSEPDMVPANRKKPTLETYNSLAFTKLSARAPTSHGMVV
jgi:hypothetical protein